MNADPAVQLRLLDLQAADTALAQLAHRRRNLPELATIAERVRAAAAARDQLVDAQTELSDVEGEQRRLENDVEAVRTRAARDETRLQDGGLPARELESLQHEITSLARRQSTLEDEVLEVMERAEQADTAVRETTVRHDAIVAEQVELESARDKTFGEIDAAVAAKRPEREAIAAELPPDLVALYDKARRSGDAGAALLRQRRCDGCRMELPGSELSAIRAAAPDAIVRCENCRAILVRTAESGL